MCGDSIRVVHPLFQEEGDGSIPISPLHLYYGKINYKIATDLCALWHSSMPIIKHAEVCRPCYAAVYENIYYAVAIWSFPIAANRLKDGRKTLELRRLAISDDAPKNTASNMISWMAKDIKKERKEITKLISYQDTGSHKGTIYKASNWNIANIQKEFVSWKKRGKKNVQINDQSKNIKIRWEYDL